MINERRSHEEMAERLERMMWSKQNWLDRCSSGQGKRPDFEIQTQRENLEVLTQAYRDYKNAAERVRHKRTA